MCDCGKVVFRTGKCLRRGTAQSCGCYQMEQTSNANRTHGHTSDRLNGRRWACPEYKIWIALRRRCNNPKDFFYVDYGGRGIIVCESWNNSFEAFYKDMGPRPSPEHSIDRIDVNGNYEPGNCRWATRIQQCNNRRTSRFLTHNGLTMTVANWARHLGLKEHTIHNRLRGGWSLDRCLVPYLYPQASEKRKLTTETTSATVTS